MVLTRTQQRQQEQQEQQEKICFFKNDLKKQLENSNSFIICDEDTLITKIQLVINIYNYIVDFIENNKYFIYTNEVLMELFMIAYKKTNNLECDVLRKRIEYPNSFNNNRINDKVFYETMEIARKSIRNLYIIGKVS